MSDAFRRRGDPVESIADMAHFELQFLGVLIRMVSSLYHLFLHSKDADRHVIQRDIGLPTF